MIDLNPNYLDTIKRILAEYVPDCEVRAFGSRVKWTAKDYSDLDLAIIGKGKIDRKCLNRLEEAFENSALPVRVDVLDWYAISENFCKVIEEQYEVIQSGNIASEWQHSTWGEAIVLEYGKALRGYKNGKGSYRVYGSNGPIGWTSEPLVSGPGVILGRKGAYRGIEFSKNPFFVIDTAYYVKPKIKLHMRWLYYAMKYYKLGDINDGSPIPSTTRAAVYVRDLMIPPIKEQEAIAHSIGTLDDKIESNRRMNETLEAMARALFKSWFIDFDPVIDNTLAAGNPIPEEFQERAAARESLSEARKPLPEEVRNLFPSEFEHSKELEWIPKGWKVKTIGDILELAYGKSLAAKNRRHGNYPVYGSGGIGGYHCESIVKGPGIIVGRKGTVGSIFWEEGDFFPIDTVFFVKLKNDIPQYWVYQNLLQMDIKSLGADSAVPGVNRNAIYAKKWIFPNNNILNEYWLLLSPFMQKRQELTEHNRSLEALRDTLLPKLLSGEFRIFDAEKLVEKLYEDL